MRDRVPPVLEARNLWHIYYPRFGQPVEAVKDASLQVTSGEVVAIIGQNGAGKTTLVKHFNGLLKPTRGQVFVNGEDTKEKTVAQLSRIVGYVFQNPDNMIFLNTVREELQFGPRNLGISSDEIEKGIKYILTEFELEEYSNHSPYILSNALKRRLTVASVLAMEPKILVLDEPTMGQDRLMANKLMRYVMRLNGDEGLTVVLITHDMRVVAEFCPRAVVVANGLLLYDGPSRELFLRDDLLKRAFLEPPQITELSLRMRESFGKPILSVEEMVEEVRSLKSTGGQTGREKLP